MFDAYVRCTGELSAVVIRADGTREDLGVIAGPKEPLAPYLLTKPMSFWEKLWLNLRKRGLIPWKISLASFLIYEVGRHFGLDPHSLSQAIVTTAGATFLAQDFNNGVTDISTMNFHDSGTGGAWGSTVSITAITNVASFQVTTSGAHGKGVNDLVTIASVVGATGANNSAGGAWQIGSVPSTTTFTVLNSGGSAPGAYTSGGTVQTVNGIQDTALTTAAGPSRVAGTQSNPSSGQYRSVATISYTGSATISEWGLFSASSAGTLWDRRWFNTAGAPATSATTSVAVSGIGVNNLDSIQFTYTMTVSAGGS